MMNALRSRLIGRPSVCFISALFLWLVMGVKSPVHAQTAQIESEKICTPQRCEVGCGPICNQVDPPAWNGLEPVKPFYLNYEKLAEKLWSPNRYIGALPSTEVRALEPALVEAYANGSATVYPRVVIWRSADGEAKPFAIYGEPDPSRSPAKVDTNTVFQPASQIIGLDRTVGQLSWALATYTTYPTRVWHENIPRKKNEAIFWIGDEAKSFDGVFYKRALVLKKLDDKPCPDNSMWADKKAFIDEVNKNGAYTKPRCRVYRTQAKLVELAHSYGKNPSMYRESNVGEVFVRAQWNFWYDEVFYQDSWWQKIIDPIIQWGRNRG
jgi:hypothetical protein